MNNKEQETSVSMESLVLSLPIFQMDLCGSTTDVTPRCESPTSNPKQDSAPKQEDTSQTPPNSPRSADTTRGATPPRFRLDVSLDDGDDGIVTPPTSPVRNTLLFPSMEVPSLCLSPAGSEHTSSTSCSSSAMLSEVLLWNPFSLWTDCQAPKVAASDKLPPKCPSFPKDTAHSVKDSIKETIDRIQYSMSVHGAQSPQVAPLYISLGDLMVQNRKINRAITSYNRAVNCEASCHTPTALLKLASAQKQVGDVSNAIQSLQQALLRCDEDSDAPTLAAVHHQMGECYVEQVKLNAAYDAFECSYGLRRGASLPALAAVSMTSMAGICELQKDFEACLDHYQAAWELYQEAALSDTTVQPPISLMQSLAMAQERRNLPEAALSTLRLIASRQRASCSAPSRRGTFQEMARLLELLGENEQAAACRNEAARVS